MGGPTHDPPPPVLAVGHARLDRMLTRDAYRHASLAEYAAGAGLPVDDVVALLRPYLDEGGVALEVVGRETFLLTAPGGRPIPTQLHDVAPNLWEALRRRCPPDDAARCWRVVRGLERAGWAVEVVPGRVTFGLGHLSTPPLIGLTIGPTVVPTLVFPPERDLSDPIGLVAEYDRIGAAVIAVCCPSGGLDRAVTAVRRWFLSRRVSPSPMTVIVLEAPRFQPTLLSAADAAVRPASVSRRTLEALDWAPPPS